MPLARHSALAPAILLPLVVSELLNGIAMILPLGIKNIFFSCILLLVRDSTLLGTFVNSLPEEQL
jgi:hypothetical protein